MKEQIVFHRPLGANITTFGMNLKKIRFELGFDSQDKFARFLEVNRPQLGAWEDGRCYPGLPVLFRICEKLRIADISSVVNDKSFTLKTARSLKSVELMTELEKRYYALSDRDKNIVDGILGL